MSFQHAVQAAKDCGDREAHCLSTEGLAAVYFRMNDFDKSIYYYKEALSLVSASSLGNQHSDRIVEKLSDAIQIQVDEKSSFGSARRPKKNIARSPVNGKQRYLREKQHSLIAKGLEEESSEEEIFETDSEEESESSSQRRSEREHSLARKKNTPRSDSPPRDLARKNHLHTANENGMQFNMKSTLGRSNYYEQPVQNEAEEISAIVEKQTQQIQLNAGKQTSQQKESSKMCLLM